MARISHVTGYSDRTLRTCFSELEQAGLLQRKPGQGYGAAGRKSTLYVLLSPASVAAAEAEARSILEDTAHAIRGSRGSGVGGSRGSGVGGSRGSGVGGSRGSASQDPSQDLSQIPPTPKGGDPRVGWGRKRDWPALAAAWEASLEDRAREAAATYSESYGLLMEINPEAIYQEQLSILKRALPDEKARILRTGQPKAKL